MSKQNRLWSDSKMWSEWEISSRSYHLAKRIVGLELMLNKWHFTLYEPHYCWLNDSVLKTTVLLYVAVVTTFRIPFRKEVFQSYFERPRRRKHSSDLYRRFYYCVAAIFNVDVMHSLRSAQYRIVAVRNAPPLRRASDAWQPSSRNYPLLRHSTTRLRFTYIFTWWR